MSDSEDGDSYHEEGFPSLQCARDDDEGSVDSLPDLVLSAATTLSQTTQVQISKSNRAMELKYKARLFYHVAICFDKVTDFVINCFFAQELLDQLDLTGSLDVTSDFDSDYSIAGEQVSQ